jgi:hypothetical protein
MTTTTVTWNPILTDYTMFDTKSEEMRTAGKTNGATTITYNGVLSQPGMVPGSAPLVVVREWTTVEAAQEWIDFVTPYNPQSAIINS